MNEKLVEILKTGEIKDKQQAEIFAESAEWNNSGDIYGDFRLTTKTGYAEIYGVEEKIGDEVIAVPAYPQKIRFYDFEMGEVSYIPDEF